MKDPARLGKQPRRLKMVQADGARKLRDIFEKAGIPRDLWPRLAVMNGLGLDSVPGGGRFIKTVR